MSKRSRRRTRRSLGLFRLEGLEVRAMLAASLDAVVASEIPHDPAREVSSTHPGDATPAPAELNHEADLDPLMYATGGVRRQPTQRDARPRPRLRNTGVGPKVVQTTMLTNDDQVVGFALEFDTPLQEERAIDAHAYRVIRITKPNVWLTNMLYRGDEPEVEQLRIRDVEYHADENLAVIWLKDPRRATGKFRVGIMTRKPAGGPARTAALSPVVDLQGNTVKHNPHNIRLPGRNGVFVQPNRSAPYHAGRFGPPET